MRNRVASLSLSHFYFLLLQRSHFISGSQQPVLHLIFYVGIVAVAVLHNIMQYNYVIIYNYVIKCIRTFCFRIINAWICVKTIWCQLKCPEFFRYRKMGWIRPVFKVNIKYILYITFSDYFICAKWCIHVYTVKSNNNCKCMLHGFCIFLFVRRWTAIKLWPYTDI